MPSSGDPWTLTSHLLTINTPLFTRATQSPFLHLAASGSLPKATISKWLANDRLYMQGYIRLTGELLRLVQLPAKPTASKDAGTLEVRLLDWLVDALVNIRREERFFMDVAECYGLEVDISNHDGKADEKLKLEGLKLFERLFDSLTKSQSYSPNPFFPWLEGVVLFWATEKVYFEAWSWAKRQAGEPDAEVSNDEDGGAMRKEFIPNWTNDGFIKFVDTLEGILNEAVEEQVKGDHDLRARIEERAERVWEELLEAEEAFWPEVSWLIKA